MERNNNKKQKNHNNNQPQYSDSKDVDKLGCIPTDKLKVEAVKVNLKIEKIRKIQFKFYLIEIPW
jgi:hypothetical protein